jgi:hypothetical protein
MQASGEVLDGIGEGTAIGTKWSPTDLKSSDEFAEAEGLTIGTQARRSNGVKQAKSLRIEKITSEGNHGSSQASQLWFYHYFYDQNRIPEFKPNSFLNLQDLSQRENLSQRRSPAS